MAQKRKSARRAPPRAKRRTAAPPQPKPAPEPPPLESAPAPEGGATIPLEVGEGGFDETLTRLRQELKRWANKGRYTKVRFKFRGKQLLPDIPLAAVVAAEGLSFYWAGILRALVVNVAGGSLIDVELVNDSEKVIAQGREALLSGEVEKALEHFQKACDMDRDNASAWLNLGVARKLRGDLAGAREALEKARQVGGAKPAAVEAERILKSMEG